MHTAYPILTHTKFLVMKIEFVGTIRICGLVTPSGRPFRQWLALFSTASLVKVTIGPTVPYCRLVAGCDNRLAFAQARQVKRLSG